MNICDLLTDPDLEGTEFTILRRTWSEAEGVPQLIALDTLYACGILHPADPTRLDLLPEESRHEPIFLIHSTEPLSLGEREGDTWTSPDEIHWGDRVFRVFQVRPWEAYGFWKGWAVEI